MPIKKRVAKGKSGYPPLIQALLDGDEIAYSDEVRSELIGIYYFGWADDVPDEAIQRARELTNEWDARHAH